MSALGLERLLGPEDLAQRLAAGEAALFPTDTLPALAARPAQAAELWRLKQRPSDKPPSGGHQPGAPGAGLPQGPGAPALQRAPRYHQCESLWEAGGGHGRRRCPDVS